jgi:rhomboid family protein
MFPFGDNLRARGSLVGVLFVIGLLFVAYLPILLDPSLEASVIQGFAFVPAWFSASPWPNAHRLVSSVFMHGDVFHLAGNCLFLWVFGRSLQRLFGTGLCLLGFPLLGICGLLLHWVIYPNSRVPVIGASGAVATLMGAYLALFPRARIKLFVFLGGFGAPFAAPAWLFLFYWGGLELLSLLFGSGDADHVAYAVHVGGFIAGVMGAMIWKVAYPYAEERLSEFTRSALEKKGEKGVGEPLSERNSLATTAESPEAWFLFREGQQYGPVSSTEFNSFVEQRGLRETDLLWHDHATDWFPAATYLHQQSAAAEQDSSTAASTDDDLSKVMIKIKAHLARHSG